MSNKKWNKGLKQLGIISIVLLSLVYVGCTEVVEEPLAQIEEEINESNNTIIINEIIEITVQEQNNTESINEITDEKKISNITTEEVVDSLVANLLKNNPTTNIEYDEPWE